MITKENIADIYPLSPLQQGLLFHSLYAPEAAQYFEQLTCRMEGPLDVDRFEAAWQEMIDRHSILRSAFLSQGVKEPVQVVMKQVVFSVQRLDWRGRPAGEQDQLFEALLQDDEAQGFLLNRPPLMRVTLVRTGEQDWRLVWSHHHLLLDGWSLPLLLKELLAVYHARKNGLIPALPRVRPYGDYIAWLDRQDRAAAESFWRAMLGDLTEPAPFPVERVPGSDARPADRVVTRMVRLSTDQTEALRGLARQCAVTLNTVIQAAWATVLGRHARTQDVVFGVTVSGRPAELPGAESMVGLFINTLPLRIPIDPERPISQWLPDIQRQQGEIQRFSHSSLTDIHGWSGIPRGQPLFDTLYAFENFPLGEALDTLTGDMRIREPLLVEKTNYALTLVVVPGTGLDFKLGYDSERIPDWLAAGLLEQLSYVLACMAARPEAAVRELGLMPPAAPRAPRSFPGSGPVAHARSLRAAFAQAVQRHGKRIAITDRERAWTYDELDARASAIAARLQDLGVGPDVMVGLLVDKSAKLIAAMLGVVKAGGAYVPLDPRYPAERLRWMVADSGCVVVLADGEAGLVATELACPVLQIGEAMGGSPRPGTDPGKDPGKEPTGDHAAYVIYTSGSTGTPKGVVVTQHNVLRLFSSTHHWFGFDENDVWTFFHSFSFDFSVWELWGALLHGGRVVVVPYLLSRDPDAFYELLAHQRVTVLNQTPSAFSQLMAAEERRQQPLDLSLRTIVFGGEALDLGSLRPWFERHGDRVPRLVNMYGITETTVHVTYRQLTARDARAARGSLIGQPIPDLEIRLLDSYGHPVPDGVLGEICVAGAGLARGYLNQPELTAQRFGRDGRDLGISGTSEAQERLYRSGDLARRLPDGDLQYGGRIDFQVKVRGHRIELGEIENALATHPAVTRAMVLVHDDGESKRLVAYFAKRPSQPVPTAVELREHVGRTVPDYMVPEVYVALDAFPLTVNGKIDRRALPEPLAGRIETAREYVAPETHEQRELARIWQQVLDVEHVGLDDDYFALGGDSIRAIRVVSLAKKAGLSLALRDLFTHPTLRQLATVLVQSATRADEDTVRETASVAVEAPFALISAEDRQRLPVGIEDAYPLARLQAGMLYHGDDHAALLYHDVFRFAFRLRVPYQESAWRDSLRALQASHPVLRTSIHFDGYSEPLQLVHRQVTLPLSIHDLRALAEAERQARVDAIFETERKTPYDWQTPGLWRVHLVRLSDELCELILAFHHAILDGWSLATFVSELAEAYLQRVGQRSADTQALPGNAFRDFVALERRSEADPASQAYWDEILADAPATDIPGWSARSARSGDPHPGRVMVTRALPTTVIDSLRSQTALMRLPLRTLLLAVHARSLALLTGQDDLVTGLVSNGRPITSEGARALGLFLNTVPLRLRVPRMGSWLELARAVQDAELALMPHRRVPMMVLKRRQGGRELFATSFNYIHFHVYEGILGREELALEHSQSEESINIPFSVTFSVDVASQQLHLSIGADGQLFPHEQIEAAADLYARCVEAMAANPAAALTALEGLATASIRGEHRDHGFEPVHAAVARRAAACPDAIAIELGERAWTYAHLARAAAGLAARLIDAGLAPGQPAVLYLERSFAQVAAMLGVVEAGGAYVPVDPDCPPERLAEILADLEQPLVVADRAQAARLPAGTRAVIVDHALLDAADSPGSNTVLPRPVSVDPEQPAYVLFTSGSTGKPKGVVVPHGALSNHMAWFLETFPFHDRDVVLQKTPYTFDASVWEFWAALMSGSRLRLARPDGHRDPAYMAGEVAHGKVTVLQLVPSMLEALLEEPGLRAAHSLRYLFCGGEALKRATAARARAVLDLPVINLYGPTEATIQCAWAVVHEENPRVAGSAPLGRPIHNVTLSVRDHGLRMVPVGTPGELCVEGPCLATGYWKDKILTAERFVADPAVPGQRLLRTGDRARLLPDGTLEFLGRLDDQLKVRGMRVEPGEIEARLAALPGVVQVVVAARPGPTGRARLIAWVELHDAGASLDTVRAALAEQVPEYMIPAEWVAMSTWPRLASGKIDRRALPEPAARTGQAAPLAPRPGAETTLAAIWRDVLAVDQVGAQDDFFALGGDSVLSLQMVARARGRGLTLSVRDVFSHPVLGNLAAMVETRSSTLPAAHEPLPTEAPLTPVQAWFFALALPNPRHWNHALLLALQQPVPSERVERAVRAMIERRDAFRLRFARRDGRWLQIVGEQAGEPVFQRVDLSPVSTSDRARAIRDHATVVQTSLDPQAGHVFRAVHYDFGAASPGRLLLVCHHLIIDGLSWRLLLQDLALALADAGADADALPAAGRFTLCARALAEQASTPALVAELPYWQEQLRDLPRVPLDRPDGLADNREGTAEAVTITIPAAMTSLLLGDRAAALHAASSELLLAAFVHALAAWSGTPRVALMLEGHGRERLADLPETADAVGWLTSLYPVSMALPETSALACLRAVKTAVRAVPQGGSGYGLLRHVGGHEALSGRPEPVLGFNYLGRVDGSFGHAPFAPAHEDVGPVVDPAAPRPRLLDLVIHVVDGQITAVWQFCPHVHLRATIERLASLFLGGLEQLVAEPAPRQALCPADFPLARISDERLHALLPDASDLADLLPLTPVQEGMLYHALHEPQPGVYVQQVIAELRSEPEPARLEAAWQAVMAMHPMLRASFVVDGHERPLQRIHGQVAVPCEVADISTLAEPARQQALAALLDEDRKRGFALDRPPLMRITLIREAASETGAAWRLVWTHHHLLLDGWSLPLVFRDFLLAYEGALPAGETRGHVEFLRWLDEHDRGADEAFWQHALRDFPGATMPGGAPVADGTAVDTAVLKHICSEELTQALEQAARHHRVTLAALIQAAWALVLGRHGNTEDVVFGVTVAGRPDDLAGAATTVGTFINTLPMRVRLAPQTSIAAWLAEIHATQAGILSHQASALVDVARWAGVQGGAPLFEAILVHENYPIESVTSTSSALAVSKVTSRENNHYPLSLYVLPGRAMELALYHRVPRFSDDWARALLGQVTRVLEQLADNRTGSVGDLGLLDPAQQRALAAWNRMASPVDMDTPIHRRFRERAALTPRATAVIADDATLTYQALDVLSDRLAHRLAAAGVGPETPVGICLERSANMVVALLAVLKAGGYYVPMDPAFPDGRLALMVQDAAPAWVLTEAALAERLVALGARPMLAAPGNEGEGNGAALDIATAPESLAYAIHTSGSTGRPKGVMIPHRALSNVLASFAGTPGLSASDRLVSVTTLSFDIAALELFLPLTVGATVILASRETAADPRRLAELLARSKATVMQATPATWRLLLASDWQPPHAQFRAWCGGEALTADLAAALLDRGVELWNVYGPTETTIWSTINPGQPRDEATLVGRPIASTTCYVVDEAFQPLPPGVPGELVIGGAGVARGYLGLAALTAERFVPDPFATSPGARLYRTGDLACFHADGRLEVLGRLDFQVKVRGFRVELGEIETVLVALPGIAQAVVVSALDSHGEARLIAYLIAQEHQQRPDPGTLRAQLGARLPAYMVPSAWRYVDAFPLTANRKIDRKALAAQAHQAERPAAVPPTTPVQKALVEIWKQILGITELGIEDSFFELGGHSLSAARVHAQLVKVFRIDISLADFLRNPTVAGLAELIQARDTEPGRSAKIATVYLRLMSMSDEEKARLRDRRKAE